MTWLLVSTRPLLLITMPVAAAWLPWYCRLLEMSTSPGRTDLMMARSVALGTTPELPFGPRFGNPPLPPPLLPACGWLDAPAEPPSPAKYAVTPAPAAAATTATIR